MHRQSNDSCHKYCDSWAVWAPAELPWRRAWWTTTCCSVIVRVLLFVHDKRLSNLGFYRLCLLCCGVMVEGVSGWCACHVVLEMKTTSEWRWLTLTDGFVCRGAPKSCQLPVSVAPLVVETIYLPVSFWSQPLGNWSEAVSSVPLVVETVGPFPAAVGSYHWKAELDLYCLHPLVVVTVDLC